MRKLIEKEIVLATHNKGKVAEMQTILAPFNIKVRSADELNLSEPEENGKTFIERNAGKIGFAAFLPTIAEEGLASLRGIKAAAEAKKIYGNKINLAPLKKNYFIAWMTYLISGVLLGISMKQTMLETK